MRKRTPQEKKKLSYEHDTRNVYGNSPQAARKAIPLRKAQRNRANRHLANQEVAVQSPQPSENVAEKIEAQLNLKARKVWRKDPDAPLGKVVAEKSRTRKIMRERGGREVLITRTVPNTEEDS
jgi:hypothetical protein